MSVEKKRSQVRVSWADLTDSAEADGSLCLGLSGSDTGGLVIADDGSPTHLQKNDQDSKKAVGHSETSEFRAKSRGKYDV